jgi:hypothetical protein
VTRGSSGENLTPPEIGMSGDRAAPVERRLIPLTIRIGLQQLETSMGTGTM